MQKQLLTIVIVALMGCTLKAQTIQAPNLICVSTLFDGSVQLTWETPTLTNCGAFNGYRIYGTNNPSNVFNLITTITDQNQTTYTHTSANGNTDTWYYYMTTDQFCPNQVPNQSNTLDNLDPVTPELKAVSINPNGGVDVSWYVSPSEETSAYIIYKESPGGFVAIDTVFGRTNTTFSDLTASTTTQETYTIAAMDACGNNGLLYDQPHRTIILDAVVNRCEQSVTLNWNMYQSWLNPIHVQQVRVSVNGGVPQLVTNETGSTTTFTYEDIQDGDLVCFTARAVELNTSEASSTNTVCRTIDIVETQDELYLTNVSFNANNQVELTWRWDVDADIETTQILRSLGDTTNTTIATLTPTFPLDATGNTHIDTDSLERPYPTYQIQSTDSCGTNVLSNIGQPISLVASSWDNFQNRLEWTPFNIEFGAATSYQIYRVVDGTAALVDVVSATTFTYLDEVDGYNPLEATVCYYVVAQAIMEFPNDEMEVIQSQSNTTCVLHPTTIHVPNAFNPLGVSPTFRPVLVFGENSDFQMLIFNRWGEKLYETTDPNMGWDGTRDGKFLRQGVYTYRIKITQLDGVVVERIGTVMLLR